MLLPRILTAVVGIPLILFFIHLGSLPFLVFVLAVTALASYEYGAVLSTGGIGVHRWLVVLSGLLLTTAVGVSPASLDAETAGRLPALALTLVLAMALLRELFRKEHSWERAANSVFGVIFIAWTLSHLLWIRNLRPAGASLTYLLFVLVWVSDIAPTPSAFVGDAMPWHPR